MYRFTYSFPPFGDAVLNSGRNSKATWQGIIFDHYDLLKLHYILAMLVYVEIQCDLVW